MFPSFLQSPSLLLSLLLLWNFLLVTPLLIHNSMSGRICRASLKASSSPIPPIPMKAELVFSPKARLDETDLARRIEFLSEHGISSFVIANTDKKDRDAMPRWIQILSEIGRKSTTNQAEICTQYSLKHHPTLKGDISGKKEDFLQTLEKTYFGANEILLVPGSYGSESKTWRTVDALCAIKETDHPPLAKIAVGYNPYHLNPADQDRENARLLEELSMGVVSKIYLCFGTDLNKLKVGIDFCRNAAQTMVAATEHSCDKGEPISMVGSLFLPTPSRIAKQKSRPWKGVMLGSEFKSDPSGQQASALVYEMVKLYQKNGIELLWEAPGTWGQEEANTMTRILNGNFTSEYGEKSDPVINKNVSDFSKEPEGDANTPVAQIKQPKPDQTTDNQSEDACILVFGAHDVRLQDNRALEKAFKSYKHVLPVFFYTQEEREGLWGCPQSTALAVCLEEALKSLQASFESFGIPLLYCSATTSEVNLYGVKELSHLIKGVGAKAVFWNKDATPEGKERQKIWKDFLEDNAMSVACYEGQSSLLYDVDKLQLASGFNHGHFGTLMPFLKKCAKDFGPPPRPTPYLETFRLLESGKPPKTLTKLLGERNNKNGIVSRDLSDVKLVEIPGHQKWDVPIRERCPMSEQTAHAEMEHFVRNGMKKYEKERSRADKTDATSMLSRHFRIGTLSPNQLYWRIEDSGIPYDQIKTMSRRLIWRDLAYYHLFCFPDMRTVEIRPHYKKMEWVGGDEEKRRFEAWKKGMTGYPIVDAGMRELYTTGWMTQSVRMVVASFLTEYLRCDWKKGCEWFHYTLVDADSAINAMMWQNAGRSGIDQWNFVLSPKTASQDPSGDYTRKWVPELATLPTTNLVHRPWEATEEVLTDAGIILGETYPHRIVEDLKLERQLSINSTLSMRRSSQSYNSDRGYDLIDLPNGQKTVVFTKKEYRIDENGNVLKVENSSSGKKSSGRTKSNRSKKRRKSKTAANKTQ